MNKPPKTKALGSESELYERLSYLPDDAEVVELCSRLSAKTLRKMSAVVIKGSIVYLNDPENRLEYARLLSGWIATAEETVAAGKAASRIADRRKGGPNDSE